MWLGVGTPSTGFTFNYCICNQQRGRLRNNKLLANSSQKNSQEVNRVHFMSFKSNTFLFFIEYSYSLPNKENNSC
jgi:hypothetical protein